ITGAALDGRGSLYVTERGAVRKLNTAGDAFVYSKNIAAVISAIAVDLQGNAYLTGCTNLPVSSSSRGLNASACKDLYVSKIASGTGELLYATSLNGTMREPGG